MPTSVVGVSGEARASAEGAMRHALRVGRAPWCLSSSNCGALHNPAQSPASRPTTALVAGLSYLVNRRVAMRRRASARLKCSRRVRRTKISVVTMMVISVMGLPTVSVGYIRSGVM